MAAVLFLLIPLTQTFQEGSRETAIVREIRVSPPPPATPPPPPKPKAQPKESAPPELVQPPEALVLNELDISLAPGVRDALAIGITDPTLVADHNVMADIQKVFTFQDLPQSPRAVYVPRFQYPRSLSRRGVKEGSVVLQILIDETGKSTVEKVISSSHPDLTEPAKLLAAKARFSIPKIEGQAVKVRGHWPLTLKAPE
jgi:TonB family protein